MAAYSDSAGNTGIYVVNAFNNTVEKFNSSGSLLLTISKGISTPDAVSLDSAGNVYIVNAGNNTVVEFNTSGQLLHTITTGLSSPLSEVIASNNTLYVGNYGNNTVTEYTADGTLIATFSQGINKPGSLAADSFGDVYIANQGNNSVIELSDSGVLLQTITSGIAKPLVIAADSTGNVYIDNNTNKEISKYQPTLASNVYLTDSTTQVTVTASQASVTSVAYDANLGRLTITGSNLSSAVTLKDLQLTAGSNSYTFSATNDSVSNATATGFTIQLSAADSAQVNQFFNSNGTSAGNYTYNFNANLGWNGAGASAISAQTVTVSNTPSTTFTVTGLSTNLTISDKATVSPFSQLKITDSSSEAGYHAEISLPSANGSLSGTGILGSTNNNGVTHYFTNVTSNTSDLQTILENLVFTPTAYQVASGQSVNTAFTLSIMGGPKVIATTPTFSVSSGLAEPYVIALNSQGDVYTINYSNNTVSEISHSGSLLQTISTGLSTPKALAVNSLGDVYIANNGNNTVKEFNSSGVLIATLSNGIAKPDALAIDSQGNVFVANYSANTVTEYSVTGALLNTLTAGINAPSALALDSLGDIFIPSLNTSNYNILEFSNTGSAIAPIVATGYVSQVQIDSAGNIFALEYNSSTSSYDLQEHTNASWQTITTGVSNLSSLAIDSQGDVYVVSAQNNTLVELSNSGVLLQTVTGILSYPLTVAVDSVGNVYVPSPLNNSLFAFAPTAIYSSNTDNDTSTLVSTTASAQTFSPNPGASLTKPTVLTNAHVGDSVIISDASSFNATPVSDATVLAVAGADTSLANWVNTALSTQGTNLSSHAIAWFNFNGNTYLLEQAGAQDSSLSNADTLLQIVGTLNETNAVFNGHTLVL